MAEADVTRVCPKCGGTDFNNVKRCRPCEGQRVQAWRAANKERVRASNAAYRAAHHDQILEQRRTEYWPQNKEVVNQQRRDERAADPAPIRAAQRAKYQRNRERIRQQEAARYLRHKATITARNRRWHRENREKVNATMARYDALHPEVRRKARQRWKERNPEAVRTARRGRDLKRKFGKLSSGLVRTLYALQKGKCPCCNQPLGTTYHLDHVLPLALGGEHADHNMQLLRDRCNLQKSKRHPIDFMRSRGFLL